MSGNVMTLSTEKAARRAQIEMHIEMHRDSAAGSLLEVGRWLNSAKEEGVVPHGQWSAWVAEHAAMNERTAQKWMQAARELPEGSPLARLGISKIQSLMMLSSGEREEFAERIGAESLSSREVDAKVKAARAERDEALRVVGEQKKQIREMARERDALIIDARKQVDGENAREIRRLESLAKSAELGRKQTEVLLDRARDQLDAARREAQQLRDDLVTAHHAPAPEQAKRIKQLEEQLRERENEIDRLSDQLDEAQTAAMRGGMADGAERTNPVTRILCSIGSLMTQAGRAPAELARMQGLDEEDRAILSGQARLIGQWAMQILAVCGEDDGHV